MLEYAIVIQYDKDDNIYVASVPQLEGCMAHGDTPEQALHEISIAQSLWLKVAAEHGDPIPEPAMYANAM